MTRRLLLAAGFLLAAARPWAAVAAGEASLATSALVGADSHTVQPGENLYLIAKRYGVLLGDLVRQNGISNQRLIRPGMVLEIPSPPRSPVSQSEPPVAAETQKPPIRATLTGRPQGVPEGPRPETAVVSSQPEPKTASQPKTQPKPEPESQPESKTQPAHDAASTQNAPAAASGPDPSGPTASLRDPAATASHETPLPPLTLALDPAPTNQPERSERKVVSAGMIADLLLKLLLVLVFAYLSVWALKKITQRRGRLFAASGSVRILETTSLAPNRGLHLVAVGKRVFLIGSTPESVALLSEVSEVAEAGEQIEAEADKPALSLADKPALGLAGKPAFGAQLQAMLKPKQPARGIGGVIASLRDGTLFMKQAAERARRGAALDRHG